MINTIINKLNSFDNAGMIYMLLSVLSNCTENFLIKFSILNPS